MSRIATLLSVNLEVVIEYERIIFKNIFYEVRSGNYISNYIILSYLLKFPLLSYKYRAFQFKSNYFVYKKKINIINFPTGLTYLNELKNKNKLEIN